jgi:hypothetical protein
MSSYIYFKKSDDPIKIGDLTDHGIVQFITTAQDYIIEKHSYSRYEFVKLLPMLIMDAPEEPNIVRSSNIPESDYENWINEMDNYKHDAIPFKSNSEVYAWLQSKGITPEPEGLYEFDGEVEIQDIAINKNTHQIMNQAIIKPVQQESEDTLWYRALYLIVDVDRELGKSETEIVEHLKEFYKIERRKQ